MTFSSVAVPPRLPFRHYNLLSAFPLIELVEIRTTACSLAVTGQTRSVLLGGSPRGAAVLPKAPR
jgi:hypothetical protein